MAARTIRTVTKNSRRTQRSSLELFIKKISWVTGAKELSDHFSQFGKIRSITLPFDLQTGLHRGFAFVSFESMDFYEKIKKFGKNHVIDGEEVICSLASEKKTLPSPEANATSFIYRKGEVVSAVNVSEANRSTAATTGVVPKVITAERNGREIQSQGKIKKVFVRNTNVQKIEERTGAYVTQKLIETDEGDRKFEISERKDDIPTKPTVMRLTNLVKENEKVNDEFGFGKGYDVVRLSGSMKTDVTRNSFNLQKGSTNGFFKRRIVAFSKSQRKTDSDHVKGN